MLTNNKKYSVPRKGVTVKMFRSLFTIIFFSGLVTTPAFSQNNSPSIIPLPVKMELKARSFEIKENCVIGIQQGDLLKHAHYLSKAIESISGFRPSVLKSMGRSANIKLLINDLAEIGDEGYQLDVDTFGITISANTDKGIFYGIQTLLQMLPGIRTNEKLIVNTIAITDFPRFPWRGMMLDVSRHFFSTEAIKDYIDLMAKYKMNVFHWHLTDDEGWRLEIKKYPRLTGIGAWRKENKESVFYRKNQVLNQRDTFIYGGFYTQQQAKEIVRYAGERNIMVIPEIEMPGHSHEVFAAYPNLSCSEQPQQVKNSMGALAGAQANYCAGKEESFAFLQDVLQEVANIFPAPYIHIGGDEVEKSSWQSCASCQHRMRKEELKNEQELQSYFIGRINRFLKTKSRQLIGWDEILEGGLTADAVVMSWRGEKGGIEAANLKHNVIMTPVKPLYFNRYQADTLFVQQPLAAKFSINTLQNVYDYEPIPKALTRDKRRFVLGAQGCLWTEFIPSVQQLHQMSFPRMIALSEVMWSLPNRKDWMGFSNRLQNQTFNLGQKGVGFFKQPPAR